MKRLHSFILKSFLGPFVFTFFICMFILLMQFLWRYIDDLVGKGLEWTIIMEFMLYVSATLVPMALPLAILLASIMTFGNMGENYELVALKSAGISLQRIMRPLIVLIILISIGAFYFSNIVMPLASLKSGALFHDIRQQKAELFLKEGIFTNDLPGFSIKVGKTNKQTGMIYDLMIYDHRDKNGKPNRENRVVTVADSGMMVTSADKRYMEITLYHGNRYEDVKQKGRKRNNKHYPHRRVKFDQLKTLIDLGGNEMKRTDESVFKNSSYRMLNLIQLQQQQDSLEGRLLAEKANFANQMLRQRFFKNESHSYRTDSVKRIKVLAKTLNADSLYRSFSTFEKMTTVSSALNYARKAKEDIDRKKTNFMAQEKWIRKYINEWHRKFTLSFACFIFFFIGAPLGAIIRKGGLGMPVIVSVLFFIVYYIISMTGERFAKEGVLPSYQGMWISSVIILPLGIILTYKATTDSTLLNSEAYFNFFKKLNFFKKKKNA